MHRTIFFLVVVFAILSDGIRGQEAYFEEELDSSQYFLERLRLENEPGKRASYYYKIAHYFKKQFAYDSAEKNFLSCIFLYEEVGDTFSLGRAHYDLGEVYSQQDQIAKSVQTHFRSLEYFELARNPQWTGKALNIIGNSYNYIGEEEKALEFYTRAESLFDSIGDFSGKAIIYHNVAIIESEKKNHRLALDYYEKAAELFNKYGPENNLTISYANMALDYESLGELERAMEYNNLALELATRNEQFGLIAFATQSIGATFSKMGQYELAIEYLNRALEMAESQNNMQVKSNAVWNLAQNHSKLGNYEKAYQYMLMDSEMDSLVFNEQNARIVHDMETKYRVEMIDRENQILKQQDEINRAMINQQRIVNWIVAGGLTILLTFSGFLYFVNRKIKKQKNEITLQAEKLRQLDAYKSRFFANISHDIRTPLTLISGYAYQIETDTENYLSGKSIANLFKLERNSEKLRQMADEIRDLILLEEGNLQLAYSKVEIGSCLNLLVNMFDSAAEIHKTDLIYKNKLSSEQIVHMDRQKFEKIIYNLISNAFKYTPEGGKIRVTLNKIEKSKIKISIADTGKGIDQKFIPMIFDRYYQAPDNDYALKEGFGIGLALVQELTQLHGGSVSVSSEQGVGTEFNLTLPLNHDKETTDLVGKQLSGYDRQLEHTLGKEKVYPLEVATPGISWKPVILVVDDHQEIRAYIKEIIKDKFEVLEARNGKHALNILSHEQVDLIITDLMMPWLDGFELIDHLNQNENFKTIPVMVVSARTTEEDKLKILDQGVNNFISKPFDPVQLVKRIDNIILHGRSVKTNFWNDLEEDSKRKDNLEKNILKKINDLIFSRINDSSLAVRDLAEEICASERKTYRLIKDLTDRTPLDYIKLIRFDYAKDLLARKKVRSVSDAAKAIGMTNVTQFNKQYKKFYGEKPFPVI